MKKIEPYFNYFKQIATNYLPIGHTEQKRQFEQIGREDIVSGTRKNLNLKNWTLILLPFEPILATNDSRMFALSFLGAFEIVKDNSKNDSSLITMNVKDEALSMCLEIAGFMLNEHHKGSFPLGKIKDDKIQFYEVPEAFDSCVGYGVEFQFTQAFSRTGIINPLNWRTDETP